MCYKFTIWTNRKLFLNCCCETETNPHIFLQIHLSDPNESYEYPLIFEHCLICPAWISEQIGQIVNPMILMLRCSLGLLPIVNQKEPLWG